MNGKLVMVVDDDDVLRESVCAFLLASGYRTVAFENGARALADLHSSSHKPDLILLDLMMPVMGGWEFREELLRDPSLATIPVIVLTANRNVQGITADHIVYKPFKLFQLDKIVGRYCQTVPAPEDRPRRANDRHPREQIMGRGGEMGALIRAFDWSASPLDTVDRWPLSLRTMVGVMLGNSHPMAVWWGRDCLHLYNDAYAPMLGDKHPAALCAPGAAVWGESWQIMGPMARTVLDGGDATWNEDFFFPVNRWGFLEETYFTFSYSPIPDDEGRVGGVLITTRETTREVQDRRQLRTLRDLAVHSTLAKSAECALVGAAHVLAENDADVPFAFLYLVEGESKRVRLVGSSVPQGHFDHAKAPAKWPLDEVAGMDGPLVVSDLEERIGPLLADPWNRAPNKAVVVSLSRPGLSEPYGFLVGGVNPGRQLDERYLEFFRLVGEAIVATIINALSYEEERKRAEALAELDRAKTTFFSNISHEFRTPLTLMLGPTEDLIRGVHGELDAAVLQQLELLHRSQLRLEKLVNALLDFSRIEAGRIEASYEPVDLATFTRDLVSTFHSVTERAGLTLTLDCAPLDVPVYVDRDMWEQIVLNLLSNALKFTFEGGIEVSLRRVDVGVELRVKDTGVGISDAEMPQLFERFHRIPGARARTQEGSGIGLALVQDLVKLHGGRVEAESRVDAGTTFTVTIPQGSAHLPENRIGARRHGASLGAAPFVAEALRWLPDDAAAPQEERRILVADDNADMRQYLRRLLEPHWTVEVVEDGTKALASAKSRPPDLVITDVMMPGLDGFGLLRALRMERTTRPVPVVMLSARAGEEAKIEGLVAGADDYIIKPFSARELLARVRTQLELAKLRKTMEARLSQAEEALAFSETFVGILGHDLRNPLSGIIAASDLLLDQTTSDTFVRPLHGIHTRAERMARMIDQILDLTRARIGGGIRIEPTSVDLRVLAGELVDELQGEARRPILLEAEGDTRGEWDRDRLAQVISNLLGNAVEHGEPAERIRLLLDGSDAERVGISVYNAGFIPEELLPTLFDPFYGTSKRTTARKSPGLGLGLYIVREILQAHAGTIDVRSSCDEGTTFSALIPRRAVRSNA